MSKGGNLFLALMLVSVNFRLTISSVSPISIENQGYYGVVVAIGKRVAEDESITQQIEELFTNASSVLYTATKNMAYFKEITIAIPNTWKHKPHYNSVPGDFFSKAHFRIDLPNPQYGNEPYTLQAGGCRISGEYIHYTPEYVLNPISNVLARGDEFPENRLVQEWSRFRYGVFEEFGRVNDKMYPTFYKESVSGKIQPTGCTKSIRASPDYSDNCKASFNEKEFYLPDLVNCSALPNTIDDEKASLMFTTNFREVVQFCESGVLSSSGVLHNDEAPNRHNLECGGQSTWDVVKDHNDFNGAITGDVNQNTKPVFRYVRNPVSNENRVVWVLDTSNSMKGRPIKLLLSATSRCILDKSCMPDNNEIGVVSFSTDARELAELTKIKNPLDREKLVSLLPKREDNGYTAIGKGLMKAVALLRSKGKSAEGGRIILVTDGEENLNPKIDDVLPHLSSNKVIVSAIAFGRKASEKLENLTSSTGGRLYLYANPDEADFSSALDLAFFEETMMQSDIDIQPVTIVNERLVSNSSIIVREINIETQLGNNTVFTIMSPNINQLEVFVVTPSGEKITERVQDDLFQTDNMVRWIKFSIPNAERGIWKVVVNSLKPNPPAIDIFVRSSPSDAQSQPVRVKAWKNENEIKFPAGIALYADVRKDYISVMNAKVTATVSRPNGPPVEVQLKDDGATPDSVKNDGIYTGYFSSFSGSGRYSVVAKVVNNGEATLKFPEKPSRFTRSVDNEETTNDRSNLNLDNFERVVDGGVFKVEGYEVLDNDIIPPSKISDLVVADITHPSPREKIAHLEWTSPGDDYNDGNATALELRWSNDIRSLRATFKDCELVTEEVIFKGQLIPLPSGRKQTVSVRFLQNVDIPVDVAEREKSVFGAVLYFAVVAKDEANNEGDLSNVAYALMEEPVANQPEPEKVDYYLVSIYISVALFALAIVCITTALVIKLRRSFWYKGVEGKDYV